MGGLINAEVNEYYTELYIKIHKNYLLNVLELIFEALVHFDISEDDYRNELQILQVEENERQIVNTEMMTCILNDIFSNFFFNSHLSYEQILVAEKELTYSLFFKEYISKMLKHFIIYFFHEKKLSNKIQNYIHDVFSISYIKNIDDIHFLRIRNTLITEYMLKKDRVSSVLNDRVTFYLFSDNMILTDKKIEYLANMTIHKMKHAIMQSLAGD